jgi:hypothetical protein
VEQHNCSVPECTMPRKGNGLCNTHYQRVLKRGTTDLPPRLTREERFWVKVDKNGPLPEFRPALGPCWLWTASLDRKGYGKFADGKIDGKTKMVQAHRFAYDLVKGSSPEGLDLDHLCRVRHCVNPAHLEPVTRRVNLMRGQTLPARQVMFTHCPQGHPYDEENTYWYGNNRKCRKCRHEAGRRAAAKRRAGSPQPPEEAPAFRPGRNPASRVAGQGKPIRRSGPGGREVGAGPSAG